MTGSLWMLSLVLSLAIFSPAAPDHHAVTGILMDQACSAKVLKAADPFAAAAKHTKSCALMGPCVQSGYGVITAEGKFIKLDGKGDEKAKALLDKSEKKDNLAVSVEGVMKDDVLVVKSIKET